MLVGISSCYCCLATKGQVSELATGLACLAVHYSPVLVSGCFLLSLLAVLLILLRCAREHSDNSDGDVPGLAGGQGIAAVSVLPDWTGWSSSVSWS